MRRSARGDGRQPTTCTRRQTREGSPASSTGADMAVQPIPEGAEIFNEVVRCPPEAQQRLSQLQWRVSGLLGRKPTNLFLHSALLTSSVKLGRHADAVSASEYLWQRRFSLDSTGAANYLISLTNIGLYERSLEYAHYLLSRDAPRYTFSVVPCLIEAAWCLGDAARLKAILQNIGGHVERIWLLALEDLEECGLAPHLLKHQQIVRAALAEYQTYAEVSAAANGLGASGVQHFVYVDLGREDRLRLEDGIHDSLDAYYSKILPDAPYWDKLGIVVLNVDAIPFKEAGE